MAELTLSAADIAVAIKKNLDALGADLEARTVGQSRHCGGGTSLATTSTISQDFTSSARWKRC